MWVPRELPREQARQIESLASCWKRGREKAMAFVETAKGAILTWQSMPWPSEPATDIRDRAGRLKESASDLEQVLSGAGADFRSALHARLQEQRATGISPEQVDTLDEWRQVSTHDNVLDPLQSLLSLISEVAGNLESDVTPAPGRNIDHELWLIDQLIHAHLKAFEHLPGKSADSPFLLFWEGLKPVIGVEASYQAVIKQVRQIEESPYD